LTKPFIPPPSPSTQRAFSIALTVFLFLAGPIAGMVVFGPCTAFLALTPVSTTLAAFSFAGSRVAANRVAYDKPWYNWPRPEHLNNEGKIWLSRVKFLAWSLPFVALVASWLAQSLCRDLPS
jgi:hypothetical protein